MATESDDAATSVPTANTVRTTAAGKDDSAAERRAIGEFPLRKLISRRLWKHWSLVLLGLAVGAAILGAGYSAAVHTQRLGPGFVELFDLSAGRLARSYTSLLFLLAGQFALLIFWIRSRSLRDFAGRYRVWAWVAAAWFTASVCVANEVHVAWSQTVFWLWDLDVWNGRILCWLAPSAVIGLGYLWTLNREMHGCRSSRVMLWCAAVLCAASGALMLHFEGFELPWTEFSQPATAMAGALCLAASMMFHARYVIYETAEPAEVQPSRRWLRLPSFRLPSLRLRLPARKAGASDAKGPAVERKSPVKKMRPQPKANPAPAEPATKADADQSQPPRSSGDDDLPANRSRSVGDRQVRIDEPIDRDLLKGLSKRERRTLRKEHREQQRAGLK